MSEGVVVPAVRELLRLGINTDEAAGPGGTGRGRDIRPTVFIKEKVPDANHAGPVAKHVRTGIRPSGPVRPVGGETRPARPWLRKVGGRSSLRKVHVLRGKHVVHPAHRVRLPRV